MIGKRSPRSGSLLNPTRKRPNTKTMRINRPLRRPYHTIIRHQQTPTTPKKPKQPRPCPGPQQNDRETFAAERLTPHSNQKKIQILVGYMTRNLGGPYDYKILVGHMTTDFGGPYDYRFWWVIWLPFAFWWVVWLIFASHITHHPKIVRRITHQNKKNLVPSAIWAQLRNAMCNDCDFIQYQISEHWLAHILINQTL
jgi:hypothetical protein